MRRGTLIANRNESGTWRAPALDRRRVRHAIERVVDLDDRASASRSARASPSACSFRGRTRRPTPCRKSRWCRRAVASIHPCFANAARRAMLGPNQPVRPVRLDARGRSGQPATGVGGRQPRMDQYARIRDQLLAKQAELARRLERLKENLTGGRSADSQEQAQELENAEVVDALGNEARSEISKIAKALDQIKNDTYGVCSDCGETIPMARLEAYPFADRCIRCATAAETRAAALALTYTPGRSAPRSRVTPRSRARVRRTRDRRRPTAPEPLLVRARARGRRALDRAVAANLLRQPRELERRCRSATRRARRRCDRAASRSARAARARAADRRSSRTGRACVPRSHRSFASTRRNGRIHGPNSYFFGRPVAGSSLANSGGEK